MQIKIKQSEIVAAIKGYISTQGISLIGKKIDVDFTAGRGDTGLSAEITIEDPEAEAAAASQPNKPVQVTAPVVAQVIAAPVVEEQAAPAVAQVEAAPPAPPTGKSLFASN